MYFDLHKVEQLLLVGASYKHPVDYSTLTFVPVLHGTESWKRHCVEIPQASKRWHQTQTALITRLVVKMKQNVQQLHRLYMYAHQKSP